MWVSFSTFDEAVAFLDGFDMARRGRELKGFQEWLVSRLGFGPNLHWSGLVLYVAYPRRKDGVGKQPSVVPATEANQRFAINTLVRLLIEFLEAQPRK